MKGCVFVLLLLLGLAAATPASAQYACRPPTLPLPGAPADPVITAFQVFVDEIGHQVAPIPFLVFLGDVVLVDGDQALADKQSCDYYTLGHIDPSTWSDVLHIDNNALVPGQATLYSDCDQNNPNDPCLPPYEIPFSTVYVGASQLVNPVFIPESSTGPTQYQPIPGVPIVYTVDSDPVEASHPGCPTDPVPFGFQLYEDCHAVKIGPGGLVETLPCLTVDPQTGCPAFLLDAAIAFTPGWVRIREGAANAPVSDLLHFFGGHFVSFCSDRPDTPAELPEASDVGIPIVPAGDLAVDIIEDTTPIVYTCGTVTYQIFSDPPEPTAVPRTSWGKIKMLYR